MFTSEKQLELLAIAKSWFIDATFNVVKKSFHSALQYMGGHRDKRTQR